MDVREWIQAAKAECAGPHHQARIAGAIIPSLNRLLKDIAVPQSVAEATHSDWARLLCFRAGLLIRIGRAELAVRDLGQHVVPQGLLARSVFAHTIYANALIDGGHSHAALQHLAPLLRPGDGILWAHPTPHNIFAKALITTGKSADAACHLEPLLQSRDLFRVNSHTHRLYATALANSGRSGDAVRHLEPLVQPGGLLYYESAAHNAYAEALVGEGRGLKAVTHLKPLVRSGGHLAHDQSSLTIYAKALLASGKRKEAEKYLSRMQQPGCPLHGNPAARAMHSGIRHMRAVRQSAVQYG